MLLIEPAALRDDVLYFNVVASSFVYPSFSGCDGRTNENVVLPIPVIVKLPLYPLSDIFKLE